MRIFFGPVALALPLLGSCGSVTAPSTDANPSDAAASFDATAATDAAAIDAQPRRCAVGMAHVPAGTFTLSTGTIFTLGEYCMDTHPVTMSAYNLCDTSQGCSSANSDGVGSPALFCNKDYTARENDPANCIDATQAEVYCSEQGKSLPNEGEWEWAARGGTAALTYPWGAALPLGVDVPERLCWDAARGGGATWPLRPQGTCPVGTFNQASVHPFGLEDMSGNIWHWTTTSDSDGRTVRGGGWDNGTASGSADRMTTSFRNVGIPPTTRHSAVGFRCIDEVIGL